MRERKILYAPDDDVGYNAKVEFEHGPLTIAGNIGSQEGFSSEIDFTLGLVKIKMNPVMYAQRFIEVAPHFIDASREPARQAASSAANAVKFTFNPGLMAAVITNDPQIWIHQMETERGSWAKPRRTLESILAQVNEQSGFEQGRTRELNASQAVAEKAAQAIAAAHLDDDAELHPVANASKKVAKAVVIGIPAAVIVLPVLGVAFGVAAGVHFAGQALGQCFPTLGRF